MIDNKAEAKNLSLVQPNEVRSNSLLTIEKESSEEEALLITHIDRIERVNVNLCSIERALILTTPFFFEENRDRYIETIKDATSAIKTVQGQISNLEVMIVEAYPTFSWVQRLTILWFTFWGRGLDKIRIDQLWSFQKTKAKYLEMCNELKKRTKECESNLKSIRQFANRKLTAEFSEERKNKVLESKNNFLDSLTDYLDLINDICAEKYTLLEKTPYTFNFISYNDYPDHLRQKCTTWYETMFNRKAPKYTNATNFRSTIISIHRVVKEKIGEFDSELLEVDRNIKLEVLKILSS